MYLTNRRQACAFGSDNLHQIVPGTDERFGALVLELCAQAIDVDARRRELVQTARMPPWPKIRDSGGLKFLGMVFTVKGAASALIYTSYCF